MVLDVAAITVKRDWAMARTGCTASSGILVTANRDWERVKTLFHAAVDIAPAARDRFVKEQADDPQVLEEVLSLLRAYPAAEGFLSTPPDPAQVRSAVARLHEGDQLGPFRIGHLIGAGGMGRSTAPRTRASTATSPSRCSRARRRSMRPVAKPSSAKHGRSRS